MRRRMYIPEQVKRAIREHLATATQDAVSTFDSAEEDEDTMTGHLGAKLQVPTRRVLVEDAELRGEWKWSIDYYKFKGRGPRPTEHYVGADGIFVLRASMGTREDSKSLLFQAKMEGAGGKDLLKQCIKLSTWREAAFVAEYSRSGFSAVSLDEVIAHRGGVGSFAGARPLHEHLGRDFLDCLIGDDELRYLSKEKRLVWRADNGEVVATRFPLKHRVRVSVQAPAHGSAAPGIDREVKPEEIYRYRMQATAEEILGVQSTATVVSELKAAKQSLALAYHPDQFSTLDAILQSLMTSRMQEVNRAYDELSAKKKKTT